MTGCYMPLISERVVAQQLQIIGTSRFYLLELQEQKDSCGLLGCMNFPKIFTVILGWFVLLLFR